MKFDLFLMAKEVNYVDTIFGKATDFPIFPTSECYAKW